MERLKQYLAEEKLSQSELAKRVGVTQPTVWGWLNGESLPSAGTLRTLSNVTGLPIDELLSESPKRRGARVA